MGEVEVGSEGEIGTLEVGRGEGGEVEREGEIVKGEV